MWFLLVFQITLATLCHCVFLPLLCKHSRLFLGRDQSLHTSFKIGMNDIVLQQCPHYAYRTRIKMEFQLVDKCLHRVEICRCKLSPGPKAAGGNYPMMKSLSCSSTIFLSIFSCFFASFIYYMLCTYEHVCSHTHTKFVWITLFYNNAFFMLWELESKWCFNCWSNSHQAPGLQGMIIPHDERAFLFFHHFLLLLCLFYILHVMYLCTWVRIIFNILFPPIPYLIFNVFYL